MGAKTRRDREEPVVQLPETLLLPAVPAADHHETVSFSLPMKRFERTSLHLPPWTSSLCHSNAICMELNLLPPHHPAHSRVPLLRS